MSKKLIIVTLIILVVVLGTAGGYLVFSKREEAVSNPTQGSGTSLFQIPDSGKTLVSYQDASGFSFNYPKSITVKDITPETGSYYSVLELSKEGQTLKISISDGNTNPYKNDKTAALIGSTSLGGIGSSQYGVGDRLVSVAIDQGVLYLINGPKDNGFWEGTQNNILASFKFGTTSADESTVSDTNTTYEEEEVQ